MKKQFTPIAMKCNKEQFEAIKPKLKGIKIRCIYNFNKLNYLVNNEAGDPFVIYNTGKSGSKRYDREVHKTWNERIFLNACGIETEETFEITKETILKYKMKDEFPEVFEVKLEVGKWYKSSSNDLYCVLTVAGDVVQVYGFQKHKWLYGGKFGTSFFYRDTEATEQEVFEALKNEAVNRGFKIGSCVDRYFDSDLGSEIINENTFKYDAEFYYCIEENYLEHHGFVIYSKGKWAKIIQTKTKEEAEKLLGVKIID